VSKEPFHCGLRIAVPRRKQRLLAADQRKTHRFKLSERRLVEFWQGWKRCRLSVTSPIGSVHNSFTWCILGEFCLVGLKAFSQVLVKHDNITVWKNDRDVFSAHTLGLFSDRRGPEMLSETYQV